MNKVDCQYFYQTTLVAYDSQKNAHSLKERNLFLLLFKTVLSLGHLVSLCCVEVRNLHRRVIRQRESRSSSLVSYAAGSSSQAPQPDPLKQSSPQVIGKRKL